MSMARNLMRAAVGGEVPITSPNHPNLIAMWDGNISGATLFDESPNGHDMTIGGATAVAGLIGDALLFDGVGDYAESNSVPDLQSVTFAAWFKPSAAPSGGFRYPFSAKNGLSILHDHSASSLRGVGQGYDGTFDQTTPNQETTDTVNFTLATIELDQAEGVLRHYLNNVLIGSKATGAQVFRGTKTNIGCGQTFSGTVRSNFFSGAVCLERIFDRVLTGAERTTLYNGGAGA